MRYEIESPQITEIIFIQSSQKNVRTLLVIETLLPVLHINNSTDMADENQSPIIFMPCSEKKCSRSLGYRDVASY